MLKRNFLSIQQGRKFCEAKTLDSLVPPVSYMCGLRPSPQNGRLHPIDRGNPYSGTEICDIISTPLLQCLELTAASRTPLRGGDSIHSYAGHA